jgi:hypothetical protein
MMMFSLRIITEGEKGGRYWGVREEKDKRGGQENHIHLLSKKNK